MSDRSDLLQTVAAVVTALAAVGALVLIPLQLAESERIQQEQAAREIYREFLNLTVSRPELAAADWCALTDPVERLRYQAYVEYLVYTGEQVIAISEGWPETVRGWMQDHAAYLCGPDLADGSGDVRAVMRAVGMTCPSAPPCGG